MSLHERDTIAEARDVMGFVSPEPEAIPTPGVGHPAVVTTGAVFVFAVIGLAHSVLTVLGMIFG